MKHACSVIKARNTFSRSKIVISNSKNIKLINKYCNNSNFVISKATF